MEKNLNYLSVSIIFIVLLSCNTQQVRNEALKLEQAVDSELDISSSRSGDFVEGFYQELVSQTPALKEFERDMTVHKRISAELKNKYNGYESKSNSYYNSAITKVTSISDSVLQKRIMALIQSSKESYSRSTSELNVLLKMVEQNSVTLNDKHSILKIVLTLPLIEKFQTGNLPDKTGFNELIEKQKQLIEQINGLTPKY
jgi:hypothetical protein